VENFLPLASPAQFFGRRRKTGADAAGEEMRQQRRIRKQNWLDGF